MNKIERQSLIIQKLNSTQNITVEELGEILKVSSPTVRRDLYELSEKKLVERYYGGAALKQADGTEPPILARAKVNLEKKRQIGRAAAELIRDGETVFLSGGTTTVEVAKNLVDRNRLTVITSAINIVNVLVNYPNISVIVPGGTLVHEHLTLVGPISKAFMTTLRADKAVMGVSAIDINEGITTETLVDAETDKAIIEFTPIVIVVADSSKFGLRRVARVAPLEVVKYLVTDDEIREQDKQMLEQRNVHVIVTSALKDKLSSLDQKTPNPNED